MDLDPASIAGSRFAAWVNLKTRRLHECFQRSEAPEVVEKQSLSLLRSSPAACTSISYIVYVYVYE